MERGAKREECVSEREVKFSNGWKKREGRGGEAAAVLLLKGLKD